MWDLIKEELGKQKKVMRNIEISMNVAKIQDPKTTANVFYEYYTIIHYPLSKSNEVSSAKCNSNRKFLTPTSKVEVVGIIKGLGNKNQLV
jgi:hypothetical protein